MEASFTRYCGEWRNWRQRSMLWRE